MRILVTGANGMVGRAVAAHCEARGDEVLAFAREHLDITNKNSINAIFDQTQPEAVINCAAWTDVDGCELNSARAFSINARGVENLARAARRADARFLTISTDYVFDGERDGFYTQRDTPAPQSVYAKAKLEGERRAQNFYARTIVVRTGWIFGAGGKNFLARIFELARQAAQTGTAIKAIEDAYGTPTYAIDLAARLRELVELDLPGIYHVVCSGEGASYADFAREAVALCGLTDAARIKTISSASLARPVPRPRNSRLRCLLSEAIGLAPLPHWRDGLQRFSAHDT